MEFSQLYEIGMSIQQLGRFREAGSRSLTAILTFIEAHLNQILREIAPEYLFAFTGKDIKKQRTTKHLRKAQFGNDHFGQFFAP